MASSMGTCSVDPAAPLSWVAVKELKLSYDNGYVRYIAYVEYMGFRVKELK